MRMGARTRFVLMISLGFLVGFSFIAAPGVLTRFQGSSSQAPKTSTNSTGGTTTVWNPSATGSVTALSPSNVTRNQPTPSETGLTVNAFFILVSLLVIPALVISTLTSTWAARRRKARSYDESEIEGS